MHNIQLMETVNYYSALGDSYDKDRNAYTGIAYTDWFKDRKGLNVEVGLRIEL